MKRFDRSRASVLTSGLVIAALALAAGPAAAGDWGRRGWFVGAGGGLAVDFLSDAIADKTGGLVEISETGTFNFRGGYRLFSWLAFEGMYEGAYGYKATLLGEEISSFDTHSLLVNGKLIAPIWRLHPYFTLGVGAQQGSFNGKGIFDSLDTSRWDFVLRTGLGLDSYVTENWVVNLELTPSIRFKDYSDIPSETTDNVTLTFSAGVQYRF